MIVAIDGPAGCGKGTITKVIGEKLNLINIDTGAMYRCVTLACLRKGITVNEETEIEKVLENIKIVFEKEEDKQKVILNGEDVSEAIRTSEIDNNVAKFAALKIVRDKMTPLQREMGKNSNIIMEGRDIGTVVFPDADVKIFLECSIEERARRRYRQNIENGIDITYEEVLEAMKERHKLETEREIAPFKKADDAVTINNTNMSLDEVVGEIIKVIKGVNK